MTDRNSLHLAGVRPVEGSRVGYGVSLTVVAASVLGCVASALMSRSDNALGTAVGLLSMPFLFGLLATWWYRSLGKKPAMRAVNLLVTDDAILLDGKSLIARSEIASAVVWPARNLGTMVRLERKGVVGGALDVLVGSLDDGRAMVRVLREGGAQKAHRFRIAAASPEQLTRRVGGFWLGAPMLLLVLALAGGFIGKGTAFDAVSAMVALAYVPLVALLASSARAEVGADGIAIRWFRQKSFIPMSDVVRAERIETEREWTGYYRVIVRVHRRSGPPIDVVADTPKQTPDGREGKWGHLASQKADMLIERITEAVAERKASGDADLATWESELLTRGERAIDQWVAALRGLHTDVESFRKQAGGGMDALWTVLEDAAAPAERRAAAAVALSPHLDDGGKERLRFAAQATAAAKLRIALEAAAGNDEDSLAQALEEVAQAEAPPHQGEKAIG